MTGLIVYKVNRIDDNGITSQLREFRHIPDDEAERLKHDMTEKGFLVFDFHEE